jgi:hypothetical protein
MANCIPFKIGESVGILCMSDTDFKCPVCGCLHTEDDYYARLDKSKNGLIYKHCKGCKRMLGITTDIRGDIRVWEKSEEKSLKQY